MQIKNILLITILCYSFGLSAQEERVALTKILDDLEQAHGAKFSYSFDLISSYSLLPPDLSRSLAECMQAIVDQTNLKFEQLAESYYAILPMENSFCGFILSESTREPLPLSTVQYQDQYITTDENGFFEFNTDSAFVYIAVKFIGYKPKAFSLVANEGCASLYLVEAPYTLPEVVVNNYLVKGIKKSTNGSFLIDNESIELLPGLTDPDILQTVQKLPGIQSFSEKISEINVRSGTNDQNLILWDGIRMYQQGHFFGLISAFNPYLTKDVQLIKNGSPAYYSEGVSSTIDIKTRDELKETTAGGVGINMLSMDAYLQLPIGKKASFKISGRRSISDFIKTPTYKNYFERIFRGTDLENKSDTTELSTNEEFLFYDVAANLRYDITKKDQVKINFLALSNAIDYEESETVSSVPVSKKSGLKQQSESGGINYSRIWNSNIRSDVSLYVTNYHLNALNNDISNAQQLFQENEVLESGIRVGTRFITSEKLDIGVGYQFFETGISNLEEIDNPPFRRFIKEVNRAHSIYAESNFELIPSKTLLSIGFRANYNSKVNKVIAEPRLVFNHKFNNVLAIEVLGELKSQYTSQIIDLQNDFLGVEKRRWILANGEEFPIIRSKQISTGMILQKDNFLVNLDGYYKYVNGINSSSQAFQNQFQFVRSTGSYTIYGLDLLLNYFSGNIRTWASYSYAISDYLFQEYTPSQFSSNLDVRHIITSGITRESKRFRASIGVNWHTGTPYTPVNSENPVIGNEINYEIPNSDRLPNYLRVDISAKYSIQTKKSGKITFGASIWNLTNNQNIINRYYTIDINGTLQEANRSALSLTPNVMARFDF